MDTERKIDTLKGIGDKTKLLFQKAGVDTVEDLLAYYPRGYEFYGPPKQISRIEEGECAAVRAVLADTRFREADQDDEHPDVGLPR